MPRAGAGLTGAALLIVLAGCGAATEAPSASGGGEGSCAVGLSDTTLAQRAFAFDGVATAVGDPVSDRGGGADLDLPGVTFEVREWFAGGTGDTVTVDVQVPVEVGSRYLVSGEPRWGGNPLDRPIAWACGFTGPYDAGSADRWRAAFAR